MSEREPDYFEMKSLLSEFLRKGVWGSWREDIAKVLDGERLPTLPEVADDYDWVVKQNADMARLLERMLATIDHDNIGGGFWENWADDTREVLGLKPCPCGKGWCKP